MSTLVNAPDLKRFVLDFFAKQVGLEPAQLDQADLTLSSLIAASPHLTNSIDLMEAFAKTANALRRERGLRVKLPAFSLETPVPEVLSAFLDKALEGDSHHAAG